MRNAPVKGEPGQCHDPLRVEDAMGPAVLVRSDASLREVARVLLSRGVASVAVVDTDGTVRGVLTEEHLTLNQRYLRLASIQVPQLNGKWVTPRNEVEAACVAARSVTAAEVMDTRITSAKLGESLSVVVQRMLRREVEYALVYHDGVAEGMLGRRDLLRLLADASHPAVDVTPQAAVELDSKAALAAPPRTGLR
jgi:CBS domain-containing protein